MQIAISPDNRYALSGQAPKAFTRGTHRTALPHETLARVEPYFRELGITRVANVTGLDKIGVPVVSVMRPNARSLSVFQGKGLSLDAAKASGVMEAIESHHAETIEGPLRLARYSELSRSVRTRGADPTAPWSRLSPGGPRRPPRRPDGWCRAR